MEIGIKRTCSHYVNIAEYCAILRACVNTRQKEILRNIAEYSHGEICQCESTIRLPSILYCSITPPSPCIAPGEEVEPHECVAYLLSVTGRQKLFVLLLRALTRPRTPQALAQTRSASDQSETRIRLPARSLLLFGARSLPPPATPTGVT